MPTEPAQLTPEEDPRFAALAARCFVPLSQPAQVHVRHFFPPRLEAPDEGHFVLIQPWEYGYLPAAWIEPIRHNVAEVWCHTRYLLDVYRNSGVPEEKLQLVPLGVDTDIFSPQAPPYVFTLEAGAAAWNEKIKTTGSEQREAEAETAPFVFLFVGGTLHRKGIDILLEAYLKAFSSLDEVCLVIKDTGTQTVYRGQNEQERILKMIGDNTRAPLVYLEDDLTSHQLAGLYTACDCLVQPYRGEGFCLPVLEAMACGIPPIVPEDGPTDDFVDETVGWRIKAQKKPFSITSSGQGRIGPWDCVGATWMFEVDADDLARLMRRAYNHREEAKRRGEAAAARVQTGWTWEHARAVVRERVQALQQKPVPQSSSPKSPASSGGESFAAPAQIAARDQKRREQAAKRHPEKGRAAVRDSVPALPVRVPPTISLCMIVKNEERVLGACLASIKPWVDEIIVVDTGSSDRTVAIAREHGARVFDFPWCDDFSAARNESLRHATGDWLFWMDADDTIPEECGRPLHEVVDLAEERTTGFLMQVHIPSPPGDTGLTIVDHVKLFRNRPELRFEGRIHEQIMEAIGRNGGNVERTDLYVVHSGYDYSPQGQERKRERDFVLLQKDLEDRPDHPFVLFNIGMTAYHLKDWSKAIAALERCLEVSKSHESTVRKVCAMLAGCHLEQGHLEQARAMVERGLSLFPHDPELLFRAGIVYREIGDLAQAEASYLKLLTAREIGHIDSLDISITGFKAHHNLALVYQDMGRFDEAEKQWHAAVQANPGFEPSWRGLFELLLRLRRFDDARSVVAQLTPISPALVEDLQKRLKQMQKEAG